MDATKFRIIQKELGLNNIELAERLGYTPEHVSGIRNGREPVSAQCELLMQLLRPSKKGSKAT